MITETEAYHGPHDLASHASRGKTPRTTIMFGPAGHAYIYLIYGMYYCLNVVTEEENYPAAVLIRAVEGISGPGRLTRHFKITKAQHGIDMATSNTLYIEDRGITIPPPRILRTPRIGIDYAGAYKDKKWRFVYLPPTPSFRKEGGQK
jgi:DNA-3-methyladenine glycosylase